MPTITLPDGNNLNFTKKVTGAEVAEKISKSLAKQAMVISVDGELKDLDYLIEKDCSVKIFTSKNPEGLETIRHDTAHILAMENTESNGERFALAESDLWYRDIANLLRKNGFDKAPTFSVPVWLAKILAVFNKELKVTVPYLGRVRSVVKATKAKDILGWNPRPSEDSILEIANQIKDMGLIK